MIRLLQSLAATAWSTRQCPALTPPGPGKQLLPPLVGRHLAGALGIPPQTCQRYVIVWSSQHRILVLNKNGFFLFWPSVDHCLLSTGLLQWQRHVKIALKSTISAFWARDLMHHEAVPLKYEDDVWKTTDTKLIERWIHFWHSRISNRFRSVVL